MDSLTHLYFAHRLLSASSLDTSAAICGLFPQIDRIPAYFHRLYAHPFSQMKRLGAIGSYVVQKQTIKNGLEQDYEWRRFLEELPRMKRLIDEFEGLSGNSLSNFSADPLSVTLAVVSHTYNDTFNNPVQAFLPQWVYPSGRWQLWSEVHGINFRTVLYSTENISALRDEFFQREKWNLKLDAASLISAMINRTAEACALPVPKDIVDTTFNSLGTEVRVRRSDVENAEQILIAKEHELSQLIKKFSVHHDHSRPASIS